MFDICCSELSIIPWCMMITDCWWLLVLMYVACCHYYLERFGDLVEGIAHCMVYCLGQYLTTGNP